MASNVISIKKAAARKGKAKKKLIPTPLPKREAQQLINKIARTSEKVLIPKAQHAQERSEEREFTYSEIIEILQEGIIKDEPVFESGRWRYKVELAGFRRRPYGAAVVSIIREKEVDLIVVTVMWLDN